MKFGAIYVNGWAAAENPHVAGIYLGRAGKYARMLYPDGKVDLMDPRSLVYSGQAFTHQSLRSDAERAVASSHEDARNYASDVLWPAEYDPEVRSRIWSKDYEPPSFEDWKAMP